MTVPYLVLFMRKLWFNVIPGKDLKADLMFHFPQVSLALPPRAGSTQEAGNPASFVFKIQFLDMLYNILLGFLFCFTGFCCLY